MEIGSVHIQPMKPSPPAAPTPPPGGNIENRQPPPEPSPPSPQAGSTNERASQTTGTSIVDASTTNTATSPGQSRIDLYA